MAWAAAVALAHPVSPCRTLGCSLTRTNIKDNKKQYVILDHLKIFVAIQARYAGENNP